MQIFNKCIYHLSCVSCKKDWWETMPFPKECPYCHEIKRFFQEDNYMNKENFGDYRIDYSKDNPVLYDMKLDGSYDQPIEYKILLEEYWKNRDIEKKNDMDVVTFVEEYLGIELLPYQKKYLKWLLNQDTKHTYWINRAP